MTDSRNDRGQLVYDETLEGESERGGASGIAARLRPGRDTPRQPHPSEGGDLAPVYYIL